MALPINIDDLVHLPPVDHNMLQRRRVIARNYRNRRIGEFLKELSLTEARSTGFPMIHTSLEKNGSPKVEIETDEDRSYFLMTIYARCLTTQETTQEKLGETQIAILRLLQDKPKTTREVLGSILGKGDATIKEHIAKLKKIGFLERKGSTKSGTWSVTAKFNDNFEKEI